MGFTKKKTEERIAIEKLLNRELCEIDSGKLSGDDLDKAIENVKTYNTLLNDACKRENEPRFKRSENILKWFEIGSNIGIFVGRIVEDFSILREGFAFEKEGSISSFFLKDLWNHRRRS